MMSNESHIQGNENIVIQEVTDSTIILNVDGRSTEIINTLEDIQKFLKRFNTQWINYAGRTLNLENADEADLNTLLGKQSLNELLTKQIFEAIVPFNPAAERSWEDIPDKVQWEVKPAIVNTARSKIIKGFVRPIGFQIEKLFSIDNEDLKYKISHYIPQCITVVKRSLDLVVFALISKLWDQQKDRPRKLSDEQLKGLERWFKKTFEHSIQERFEVLKMLHGIFSNASFHLDFPMPALVSNDFIQALQPDSPLARAISELESLDSTAKRTTFLPMHCYEAEKHLATFLQTFAFLAGYQMASIGRIHFHHMRIDHPSYLHRFEILSTGKHKPGYSEKFNYDQPSISTNTVLMYQGKDYHQACISLSPFVIDFNMLTNKEIAKIYFYQSQVEDGGLEYLFHEAGETRIIRSLNIYNFGTKLDALDIDQEKHTKLKLDFVVEQFRDAYRCLLGKELEFDSY